MTNNVDPEEVAKFDAMAKDWWDPNGPAKPLHQLNPLRLQYIQEHSTLPQQQVLDVGCGGGILSESMAKLGAKVTGLDMSTTAIDIAKQHADNNNIMVDYQHSTIEAYTHLNTSPLDVITCMELLEHVPDPSMLIKDCAAILKPNGRLFVSTINRNLKAFLLAIIGAEYILNLLPKGTHHYDKFIRPSELNHWAEAAGLRLIHLQGMNYSPLTQTFTLSKDVSVNYLCCFEKNT